jgi:proteasome lid subunit RPN8/RPN11
VKWTTNKQVLIACALTVGCFVSAAILFWINLPSGPDGTYPAEFVSWETSDYVILALVLTGIGCGVAAYRLYLADEDHMIRFSQIQFDELVAYARAATPDECCGWIGGFGGVAKTIYPLRNVSVRPRSEYEAAPEDLFAAQRAMRERGEELLAIYHSHPRQAEPQPSDKDIRLAYYPQAVYLIVGLAGERPTLGAFRLFADVQQWEPAEIQIAAASLGRT